MSLLLTACAPLVPARQGLPSPARRRTLRLGLAAATLLAAGGARALDAPKGKVVLSVVGTRSQANAGTRADFDMAMLDAPAAAQLHHQHALVQGAQALQRPAAA